jgi:hypothetical protein
VSVIRAIRNAALFVLMAAACWGFALGTEILVHVLAGWM